MAWTCIDVKGGQVTSANDLALTAFGSNPVAGDLIVVCTTNWNTIIRTILTPTDSIGGNTYTQLGSQVQGDLVGLTMHSCLVTNGGASFVITVHSTSTTAALTGVAWLWRQSAGTPIYNGDFKSNSGISVANPSSGTTSPAPGLGSMFVGMMGNNSSNSVTDGVGWNAIANGFDSTMLSAARQTNNSPNQDCYAEYLLADVASNADWTEASDTWGVIAASHKQPSGDPEPDPIQAGQAKHITLRGKVFRGGIFR